MAIADRLNTAEYRGGLAFSIAERGPDRAVARMAVTADMLNPFGTVHAGALIWFADVTATVCAIGDPAGVRADGAGFPLAINLHAILAGNRRDGTLTATARPVKRGRGLIVIRTEVTDEAGRLLIEVTTSHVPARAG